MSIPIKRFLVVGLWTFVLSVLVSLVSKSLLAVVSLVPSLLLLFFIVGVGVAFDAIGVAATAATEAPLHAMAADRVPGAREAVVLVRNADSVGTFANDIVGDIAGTVSGAVGASIVFQVVLFDPSLSRNEPLLTTLVVAFAAALTVGGKAYGKSVAISKANQIIYSVGFLIYIIKKYTGLNVIPPSWRNSKRRTQRRGGNSGRSRNKRRR